MSLTGALFFVGFFAGLLLSVFRHPVYGLYTYIAVFYLDPTVRWWGAAFPDLRWSLVAALVTLVSLVRSRDADAGRPAWYSTLPGKVLICFALWMWIQNLWAESPEDHVVASVLFSKYVVLYYMIYKLVRTPEQFRSFFALHVAGCLYLGALAYLSGSGGRLEGVGGPGISEANALAMHVGTAIMLGSMIILSERKWAFWLALLAMPLMINTFVMAGSRGGFLAAICGGIVLWFMKPAAFRRTFMVLATLGLALFLMLASEMFWERMGTIEHAAGRSEQMDSSAESRYVMFGVQWRIAQDHPFGSGHRGTVVLAPAYIDAAGRTVVPGGGGTEGLPSSHNTFMTALSEQGIPGAIMYLAILIYSIRVSRVLNRRWRGIDAPMAAYVAGIAAALSIVFVAGQFVDYIKTEVQIWLFALLTAALYVPVPGQASDSQPVSTVRVRNRQ